MSSQNSSIGALRHRIALQSRRLTPGDTDLTDRFTTIATVNAEIRTIGGIHPFDGSNAMSALSHSFVIRHRSDLSMPLWILFDQRRFEVERMENLDERRRFIRLTARERGSQDLKANSR